MADDQPGQPRYGTTLDAPPVRLTPTEKKSPALTVLYHPDWTRIGDVFSWAQPEATPLVTLSRIEPNFSPVVDGPGSPLGDPYVSRKPVHVEAKSGGSVCLSRQPDASSLSVDGEPVMEERTVTREELRRGAVVELAGRIVLLLSERLVVSSADETFGLLGHSESIMKLRSELRLVARHTVPVLLRGESGSGKELAARAIHDCSDRSRKSYVSVNMAAIPTTTAASQLFGHVRGAFSGAEQDHPGFFRRAHGGTLFLDEVGDISMELQTLMLRALETGEIQPVGAKETSKVDVRLITATDADLERAIDEGRYHAPLLHRLAGFQIQLPPLRDRVEDLGLLMATFLEEELRGLEGAEQLRIRAEDPHPWLPSSVVVRLARFDWPGNVRQLKNGVRQLVLHGLQADRDPERWETVLASLLRASSGEASTIDSPDESPSSQQKAARLAPSQIGDELLVNTLRANDWRLGPAARALGISRTSLYALIEQCPQIRTANELTPEEIRASSEKHAGRVDRMAQELEVSRYALSRRMKELAPE